MSANLYGIVSLLPVQASTLTVINDPINMTASGTIIFQAVVVSSPSVTCNTSTGLITLGNAGVYSFGFSASCGSVIGSYYMYLQLVNGSNIIARSNFINAIGGAVGGTSDLTLHYDGYCTAGFVVSCSFITNAPVGFITVPLTATIIKIG